MTLPEHDPKILQELLSLPSMRFRVERLTEQELLLYKQLLLAKRNRLPSIYEQYTQERAE